MDPRQLAVLRELGDRGSVTAVAAALHISPSAVSQQLAALQRGAAVPLTERRGRVLVLTDAGRAVADAAADVAEALARAEAAVEDYLADPEATVAVAAFSSAAATLFPRLVAALADAGGPRVACADEDVAQADFPALCADYDVVIAHRPEHGPGWPRTVRSFGLLREPIDVALPVGHRLAAREALTAADVAGEPWIAVHEGFPLLGAFEAVVTAAGRPIRPVHRINEFSVSVALVAAGGGVALVPRYTGPQHPGVVLRPIEGAAVTRRIEALARPERLPRAAVASVLRTLARVAGELSAGDRDGVRAVER
ncbi:LysR family transcriptional regulator [Motilibacter aurantiacus]|uniref:LysR family transcriptional regulator n=1 Tax=Motilibacter aurantiacus TaxID=2714955 RepID=UPI00140773AE|nr:LysR family transcriptional regulator [Motilibacter aurantiacus]NHC46870.1 LysR family transcriptional regulator [Motilibacter aurantiacus]